MLLTEYMQTVIDSERSDWYAIKCEGADAGPSYRYALKNVPSHVEGLELTSTRAEYHSITAVFVRNIAISMAWGMLASNRFPDGWATQFPDKTAYSRYVDLFYHGTLVHRDILIDVDGGKVSLPQPDVDQSTGRLTAPSGYIKFARLLNRLESGLGKLYDGHLAHAGINEVDQPWPRFMR